ncbi:hypothetical protein MMC27_007437 [Xylographa pallens]|nr:hypothetical protein [Xylographa pallens]
MPDQSFDAVNDVQIFDDIDANAVNPQRGDIQEVADVGSAMPLHEEISQEPEAPPSIQDTPNTTADASKGLGVQPSPALRSTIPPTSEDDHLHFAYRPGPPSSRDPTYLIILIPTGPSTHRPLYAQLDTAASANFITSLLLGKLRALVPQPLPLSSVGQPGSSAPTDDGQPSTPERVLTFNGASFSISHTVALTFFLQQLGAEPKEYTLDFEIVQRETEDDDVPHLLLGAEWLKREHVLTLDPAFAGAVDLNPEEEWIEDPPDGLQPHCFNLPKAFTAGGAKPQLGKAKAVY